MTEQARTEQYHYRRIALSAMIGVSLLTAGCNQKAAASGQTVATVDDSEITTSDLQLEMANIPPEQRKESQALVIKTLIDRKVLAEYAKSQGMDRNPDFVLQLRRTTELLLAERAAQQIAANAQQPINVNQINEYLDNHPEIANRQILTLDQLTFPMPNAVVVGELKLAKTMEDVVAILQRNNIKFGRTQAKGDSISLRDDLRKKLDTLQPGEPLIVLNQPMSTANLIIGSEAAPLDSAAAADFARKTIAAKRTNDALQQRGLTLRKQAKITYGKGYAPPSAGKTKP